VKAFGDPAFFRMYEALLGEAPGSSAFRWTHRGVEWVRTRHSYTSPTHGFGLETVEITKPGSNCWSLLVVKEFWWDSNNSSLKSSQWAKPMSGKREEIRRWVQLEERRQSESRKYEPANERASKKKPAEGAAGK
jgi:hypothetical protein